MCVKTCGRRQPSSLWTDTTCSRFRLQQRPFRFDAANDANPDAEQRRHGLKIKKHMHPLHETMPEKPITHGSPRAYVKAPFCFEAVDNKESLRSYSAWWEAKRSAGVNQEIRILEEKNKLHNNTCAHLRLHGFHVTVCVVQTLQTLNKYNQRTFLKHAMIVMMIIASVSIRF